LASDHGAFNLDIIIVVPPFRGGQVLVSTLEIIVQVDSCRGEQFGNVGNKASRPRVKERQVLSEAKITV
jgi:hypothetical protein